ncbi:MAG: hypothetical protein DIU80_021265 [Chloroflexota bacterium]|nr:MAG: hypothetical protein DIU80_10305 [Chloroflexota bacterium]
MTPDERIPILQELAHGIARRHLEAPARIALDVIAPLGFLAGQIALFARPLLPSERWRMYAAALEDEESWGALRRLIDDSTC